MAYTAGILLSRTAVGIMLETILPDVLPCPNYTRSFVKPSSARNK
ncbi:MAG TPA: hypothetical protein VKA59_24700 [Vicinamibacterales bacterium]|nr:hypothetical protein [Vicinamibacterales bacterium]